MQINFCTCDLDLRNCHACNNRKPKRPFIENKVCDYHTSKLNMVFVGLCTCDSTQFMARPCILCYHYEFIF